MSHSVGNCGVDADGNDQICNARISTADLGNEESMSDNTIGVCVTPVAAGFACISGYGRPSCPSSTHHESDQTSTIDKSMSFACILPHGLTTVQKFCTAIAFMACGCVNSSGQAVPALQLVKCKRRESKSHVKQTLTCCDNLGCVEIGTDVILLRQLHLQSCFCVSLAPRAELCAELLHSKHLQL